MATADASTSPIELSANAAAATRPPSTVMVPDDGHQASRPPPAETTVVAEGRRDSRWPSVTVWAHLVRRFVGSLWPGGPSTADDAWARTHLLAGEVELWRRMSGPDRRHAVGVARRTQDELGDDTTRPMLAAALLHDVGKVDAGIGPIRRSLATLVGMVVGRLTVEEWSQRPRGVARRFGRYLRHDAIGADLLHGAGSDELTITWAREHHLPPDRWSVPAAVGAALKSADDD